MLKPIELMLPDPVILEISLVVFIATVFRSAFGFGESLVAVPLLALLMPLNVAVPLSVLVSTTIAGFVVIQDRNKIHFSSAGRLVLYALAGIPAGLWLLVHSPEHLVKAALGVIIIVFSIYLLTGNRLKELKTDNHAWLLGCGLLSGILGGAYGLNGPPLVIYGAKRRWTAQHFRATLQAYFLIASFAGVAGYWMSGLLVPVVFRYFLFSLPALIPAILIGRAINQHFHADSFFKYAYIVLLGLGLLLIINSLQVK